MSLKNNKKNSNTHFFWLLIVYRKKTGNSNGLIKQIHSFFRSAHERDLLSVKILCSISAAPPYSSLVLLYTYLCEFQSPDLPPLPSCTLDPEILLVFFFFLPFSTGAFTASLIASSNNNIKPRILKIWIHVHKTIWWILSETPQDEWISLCPASFPPELVLHLYPQHRNQLESQQVKNPETFKNLFNEIIVYWYNDKFYVSTWQSHGTQFLAKTLDVAVEVFFFSF